MLERKGMSHVATLTIWQGMNGKGLVQHCRSDKGMRCRWEMGGVRGMRGLQGGQEWQDLE